MSDSIIEHGIPIPPSQRKSIDQKFPEIVLLQIGDSFVIPEKDSVFPIHIEVCLFGLKHDARYEVREVENGDVRVWRVE
jgi:hypothetical protein